METGMWLLGLGLVLAISAVSTPTIPTGDATLRTLQFLLGGGMSFFRWTMTLLAIVRHWELHPLIGVFLWLCGFGLAALALHHIDERRKRKTA